MNSTFSEPQEEDDFDFLEYSKNQENKKEDVATSAPEIKIPPRARISSVKNDGILTIKFTKSMKYSQDIKSRFEEDKVYEENFRSRRLGDNETSRIDIGLNIEVEASNSDMQSQMGVDWFITTLEPKLMQFQLVFENPKLISMGS